MFGNATIIIGLIVAVSVVFQYFYRRNLKKNFERGQVSELVRREFGQVTGLEDAKKTIAHHGLVIDLNTGRYYSQHRHCKSVIMSK